MPSKVLTANRLSDGKAVWLACSGVWTDDIDQSFVARHAAAVESLDQSGKQAVSDNQVVDVMTIDVEESGTHIRPARLRERIRAGGPTIDYGQGAPKPQPAAS